ncbi:hypothetical protein B0T19DRAFT_439587 [Cercophora scortea]|uniref:Uncharacterized protein n=1 Tax=Cercophora scortea TaxID=314031 RepID=A0AAE0MHG2_9PEZI|nr:hypothetical protein B0T19DRAFT_439587 [Cercophora scortea]
MNAPENTDQGGPANDPGDAAATSSTAAPPPSAPHLVAKIVAEGTEQSSPAAPSGPVTPASGPRRHRRKASDAVSVASPAPKRTRGPKTLADFIVPAATSPARPRKCEFSFLRPLAGLSSNSSLSRVRPSHCLRCTHRLALLTPTPETLDSYKKEFADLICVIPSGSKADVSCLRCRSGNRNEITLEDINGPPTFANSRIEFYDVAEEWKTSYTEHKATLPFDPLTVSRAGSPDPPTVETPSLTEAVLKLADPVGETRDDIRVIRSVLLGRRETAALNAEVGPEVISDDEVEDAEEGEEEEEDAEEVDGEGSREVSEEP